MDNIIAALGQSNRVCKAVLHSVGDSREQEAILAAMQVPFPELTDLEMPIGGDFGNREPMVIPDSFLGGSAPRLRRFSLGGATFPGLPKLLSSAPHLVHLWISYPESWYFSSEAMAALLSALSSLDSLSLEFQSHHQRRSRHVRETRRQPPSNRSVIPALKSFSFYGDIQYLENLVTKIDTPRLDSLDINFFDQVPFHTPRFTELARFIDCTPALRALDEVHVQIEYGRPCVGYRTSKSGFDNFQINFTCMHRDSELSSLEHVCNSLHSRFTVEDLYMEHEYQDPWAINGTLWLEFLLPFTAVKNLYVSKLFVPVIARTLQGLAENRRITMTEVVRSLTGLAENRGITITEVLPSLQNIFVEGLEPSGSFQEKIGQFVAARQLSGRCIAIPSGST
jgi:hypothetical protein